MEAIQEIVASVVRDRLKGAVIESITVTSDFDSDGDPILNITVVFDAAAGDLDASRLAGMVRHLKPKLADNRVTDFPMFRFISKTDADKLEHAAA